jgi:hypothetical protein
MVKRFFFAAIIAASVWTVGAAVSGSVNVAEVSETTGVMATELYEGTAYDLVMNGNSVSGSYPGAFNIDAGTGEIYGSFNVYQGTTLIHHFTLDGDLDSGASGTVTVPPYGNTVNYTVTFSNVIFNGNSVTFTATTTSGISSVFTFTGSY